MRTLTIGISKARYKKNDSTNNGRQSWFDSDERPFYFSEIKKDFCDSLFHSNDSLFQKNKTAFQKIESWFHFSKAKSSKKQTALSLIRSKNSANQYQKKRKYFLALLYQIKIITYLCERFIYFKREYENSYLYHRQKQLHLSKMFAFLDLCKHR